MMLSYELLHRLDLLDCTILQRVGLGHFKWLEGDRSWAASLFTLDPNNECHSSNIQSSFLCAFVEEAETLWRQPENGLLESGVWTETTDSNELHLSAKAGVVDNTAYLIICNVAQYYDERQETLQVARELLLTHDEVVSQHDYLNRRLNDLLQNNVSALELQMPVNQIIEHVPVGVIVADPQLHCRFDNPASHGLFSIDGQTSDISPINHIIPLLAAQYPEHRDIFKQQRRWEGELYWQGAPMQHRWLHLSIEPVFRNNGVVSHWVFLLSDITRLKYLLQKNAEHAHFDTLTSLPNRQFFWHRLNEWVGAGHPIALCIINLRDFSRINEVYGHLVGDEVLRQVAKRLTRQLHNDDMAARLSGDEFALLSRLENSPQESDANEYFWQQVSELESILQRPFLVDHNVELTLKSSIGVAKYPLDATTSHELIQHATLALNAARVFSQDSVQYFSKYLKKAALEQQQLEKKLAVAINQKQLELYLQPIIDVETGLIVRAEALCRWRDEQGNDISPGVFIPVAEQSGLIKALGNWSVLAICEIIQRLVSHGIDCPVSLNVSPYQVADRNFLINLKHTVAQYQITAKQLTIELTENVLIEQIERTRNLLDEMRSLGIGISIDDFGTGYSSLAHLKHLPIDQLKIDRSFVHELQYANDDKSIVLAILALAHNLNLKVVAEGVETQQQLSFLHEHHCDLAQGFWFSEALPVDEFIQRWQQQ